MAFELPENVMQAALEAVSFELAEPVADVYEFNPRLYAVALAGNSAAVQSELETSDYRDALIEALGSDSGVDRFLQQYTDASTDVARQAAIDELLAQADANDPEIAGAIQRIMAARTPSQIEALATEAKGMIAEVQQKRASDKQDAAERADQLRQQIEANERRMREVAEEHFNNPDEVIAAANEVAAAEASGDEARIQRAHDNYNDVTGRGVKPGHEGQASDASDMILDTARQNQRDREEMRGIRSESTSPVAPARSEQSTSNDCANVVADNSLGLDSGGLAFEDLGNTNVVNAGAPAIGTQPSSVGTTRGAGPN